MADLSTRYMGLKLKSPIIVASSDFTKSTGQIEKCRDNGAGAVVLKSIFQEEFTAESIRTELESGYPQYAESFDYVEQMIAHRGQEAYLELIREAKKRVDIPVIASINAYSSRGWAEYARHVEEAGADALELNTALLPASPYETSEEIEKRYVDIIKTVKKEVSLPVAMKIGPYFTSVFRIADRLYASGADALVLFNRFYQFDFDIDKISLTYGGFLSTPSEMSNTLRWMALLYGVVDGDLAAATGIHSSEGVVKQLLAGATTVQVCSALYKNGLDHLKKMNEGLSDWMDKHGFTSVDAFRGRLSKEKAHYPDEIERLQFMKALLAEGERKGR
ncbi:MAG TPA: dihydroorotate dehydrogenase-like protein [Candidatus Mcinerneyibacteriales bacterium]|nr:dihydroorotate dehydrogenase-like protein [Candidatus Mcinerneyibacteriales bacterium]